MPASVCCVVIDQWSQNGPREMQDAVIDPVKFYLCCNEQK